MDLVIFDWNLSETNSGSTTQSFEHQNYSQSQNKPFLRNPSSEAEKKAVQTTKNLGTLDQPDQESGNSPINHTHLTHLWNLSPQKNPQKQRSALFAGWNRPLKKLWSLERSSSREPWGEPPYRVACWFNRGTTGTYGEVKHGLLGPRKSESEVKIYVPLFTTQKTSKNSTKAHQFVPFCGSTRRWSKHSVVSVRMRHMRHMRHCLCQDKSWGRQDKSSIFFQWKPGSLL